MLLRLRILLATQFLLPLAFGLVGLGNAHADGIPNQGTWEKTLLGRDINLHEVAATSDAAVYLYDKTLDVTWLRNSFGNGASSPVSWNAASAWAANLVTGSGGNAISDWRLPTMAAPALACNFSYGGTNCGFNPATSSSEMASLFYSTLGNKAYYDTNGDAQAVYGLTNTGSFQNMQSGYHWLGTEYAPSVAGDAWYFVTNVGNQSASSKNSLLYAMAVRSGDVMAPVPEPETYAMLLAGLGLIGAIARRSQTDKSQPTVTRKPE